MKCDNKEISEYNVQSCDTVYSSMENITAQIQSVIGDIDQKDVCAMLEEIVETKRSGGRIFVAGAGRSGLMGKAFAMRLMHMGFDAFVIGETTTPAVKADDVLVAISGSGGTASVLYIANKAKSLNAKIVALTSKSGSELGKISDVNVILPSKSRADAIDANKTGANTSANAGAAGKSGPMGTSFEILTIVFLDSIIAQLIDITSTPEEDMRKRHANTE
ncbi:Phosphoheptose isomerase [Methanosarcinaceae archaeon Ag5]|uniref:Phosphoheptose isomerase n=1 Tax=Methanolapillus africanus TaxID=3028297 RepID=A0AAE4MJH3_9EURY|nr:Phosphoheptose isomerase [Methanosarcinaceae archaeon Ag5]